MFLETQRVAEPARRGRFSAQRARFQDGWIDVFVVAAARAYLIFLATLAAVAVLPALTGWTGSVVQTGSMEPLISPGDVVVTVPLPTTEPVPIGRVITFRLDDESVAHRVVSVRNDNTIITAGDANPQVDPWSTTRTDITGQARLLVPYIGLPTFWLGHDKSLAFAGWAGITALALLMAIPRRKVAHGNSDSDGFEAPAGTTGHNSARHSASRHSRGVLTSVAAIAAVVFAISSAAPASAASRPFSKQTRTTTAWTAKAYSPITVGAMTGYAAVAGSSIKDSSPFFHFSIAHGSVATTPGSTVSNLSVEGSIDRNNATAARVMASAAAAKSALTERNTTSTLAPTLSGTLSAGVYASTTGAFTLPTTLTLDAKGDSSARFIFRTTTTLATADRSRVILSNGAKAANVWWIIGTAATLGTNTTLTAPDATAVGTFLVTGAISARGVALSGRLVSYTDAVTVYASTLTPMD